MWEIIIVAVIIAVLIGIYVGWHARAKILSTQTSRLRQDYFVGLNYLIDEQPDKAVDIFVKMLEVDTDTIETHLALGSLFRRRGEVDRAIRIHQNLIARPQLTKKQRARALAELGQDYMRAGVFDRAERLFLELVSINEETISSLRYLLSIYQQQKDWEQAINIAYKLQAVSGENMQINIAQYYCELAEIAIHQVKIETVYHYLKKALSYDKNCVRASILQAKLEESSMNYKNAIACYKKVAQQDPEFISEILKPLANCYEKLSEELELVNYLQNCLDQYPYASIMIALVDYLEKLKGNKAAIEFLASHIQRYPSLHALNRLIDLYILTTDIETRDKLLLLYNLIQQLLAYRPAYRCYECGIGVKTLYWQCPGCKKWTTMRPIHGFENENIHTTDKLTYKTFSKTVLPEKTK